MAIGCRVAAWVGEVAPDVDISAGHIEADGRKAERCADSEPCVAVPAGHVVGIRIAAGVGESTTDIHVGPRTGDGIDVTCQVHIQRVPPVGRSSGVEGGCGGVRVRRNSTKGAEAQSQAERDGQWAG